MDAKVQGIRDILKSYNGYVLSQDWTGEPIELYQPIQYTMSIPGKGIRPLCVLIIAKSNDSKWPIAMKLAYALELFHNFTLVHDDMMDQSELRRGLPALYKKFGYNAGILSGDAMLIKSIQLLSECSQDLGDFKIMDHFFQTSMALCEGQQLDMNFENIQEVSMVQYIEMITKKTSVLLASCFESGARVAGLDEADIDRAYNFGLNLGLGFQIQDDWLDFFGNHNETGKIRGGDVLRKKKSVLIITLINNIQDKLKKDQILSKYHSDFPQKLDYFIDIFNQYEIESKVRSIYNQYYDNCKNLLNSFKGISEYQRELLKLFFESIVNRSY